MPSNLHYAYTVVSCAKGDVGTIEEASSSLLVADSMHNNQLHGIMHAGAVLASKVIGNITTGSLRTEYSGKDGSRIPSDVQPVRLTSCSRFMQAKYMVRSTCYSAQRWLHYLLLSYSRP